MKPGNNCGQPPQLSLFAVAPLRERMPAPRARNRDPATSVQAADRHDKPLRRQAAEVLALIRQHPGKTACELAALWDASMEYGLRRVAVSRRCSDLAQRGFVRKGAARECTKTGSMQTTWEAT